MELIRVIGEIEDGLRFSKIVNDNIVVVRDEDTALAKIRDNLKGYRGWVHIMSANINTKGDDVFTLAFGVSGVTSSDDSQYIQTVSKCIYAMKQTLLYASFIKDEDIENLNITNDSVEIEDATIVSCYATIEIEVSNAYNNTTV